MRFPAIKLFVLLIALVLVSSACSVTRSTRGGLRPGIEIGKETCILVMPVPDPYEKHKDPAHGSGQAVAAAIRDSLVTHGFKPSMGKSTELKDALGEAAKVPCAYTLRAIVTEWEDNATPWSGKPDSYELSTELYTASTGDLAGSSTHRVVGPEWAGFERHPDRFISEAVDHSLSKIFRWQPTVFEEQ